VDGTRWPSCRRRVHTLAGKPAFDIFAVHNTISAVCKLISFRAVFEPVA
jgi:hypothetical protein